MLRRQQANAADGPGHLTDAVDQQLPWMRVRAPDIQAAMGVVGRLAPSRNPPVIYLSRVDLRSIALRRARLSGAKFRYANLARAVLEAVDLEHSDLTATDLRQAFLQEARLGQADLSRALLQGADLRRADLTDADLRGANLSGAALDEATLAGAHGDHHTTWPAGLSAARRRQLGVIEDEPGDTPRIAPEPAASERTGTRRLVMRAWLTTRPPREGYLEPGCSC